MVTAIVLIEARWDAVNKAAEALTAIDGVSEVYSVAGLYDLVAIIRVRTNEEMADVVTNRMLKVEGIIKTTTLFAFRAFSRHDLERMFSIGLEEEAE